MSTNQNNPFLNPPKDIPYNAVPFHLIKKEHFLPAIKVAMEEAQENIEKIKANEDTPNFENTILALESYHETLDEATGVFYNLLSAESDDEFKQLAQEISPMLAEFRGKIAIDPVIFAKVKSVMDNIDSFDLNDEQKRLTEVMYKGFARNGALLNDEDKQKLLKINMEISSLGPKFSQNLLGATNSFELHITDKDELKGLPESALESAAHMAIQSGKKEGWLFNLQFPSMLPVTTYADNRELRKKMNMAYGGRAFNDKFDNQEILKRIAVLRQEKAELLGFKTHADYILTERMAESPENVMNFLNRIYDVAMPAAKKEIEELKAFAKELDGLEDLQTWDSGYYREKLKKKKFDFDEEQIRPYFKLENVLNGVFTIAEKMYNLQFKKVDNVPVYHPDVNVFEVSYKDGKYVGLLYTDLHPRKTKGGGAWMSGIKSQGLFKGEMIEPHIMIVGNLTPSTDKTPSLLRLNEVRTIFHEFGHALHGLLSDCTYQTLSGANVYWDFVELPSQVMENWLTEKEALSLFAKHYETGEVIPDELIQKIKDLSVFFAGCANVGQLQMGYLDMAWHAQDPRNVEDVAAFEDKIMEKTRLYPNVEGKNISTGFAHIFYGGYSSGYYSYKWAEVLDADAFEYFKEKGIFNPEVCNSFKENVLSKGNSKHPMELYVDFRGRKPDPDSLLRRDKLL